MAKLITDTKVLTNEVRFSYAHVFEPWGANGAEPKYSVSILIPKSDTETHETLVTAIANAEKAGVEKFGKGFKSRLHQQIHDGDKEKPDDPNYKGMWYVNCSNKMAPQVVDAECNRIEDPEAAYSGCYGRITVNMYPYSVSGSQGISASLQNVQVLRDGPRLGGSRASAASDFGDTGDFLD